MTLRDSHWVSGSVCICSFVKVGASTETEIDGENGITIYHTYLFRPALQLCSTHTHAFPSLSSVCRWICYFYASFLIPIYSSLYSAKFHFTIHFQSKCKGKNNMCQIYKPILLRIADIQSTVLKWIVEGSPFFPSNNTSYIVWSFPMWITNSPRNRYSHIYRNSGLSQFT